jgi:hypothetical protein
LQSGIDSSIKKKTRRVLDDDSASGLRRPSLVKASAQRLDSSLRQLEALHKSSGADSNLRIPSGKRIKLLHDTADDDAQPASIATKKRPNFDMDFSVLADDDATGRMCLFDATDSDEFPEPHKLVRASGHNLGQAEGSLASLHSDYSDSNMDALIRKVHLSGITPTETNTAKTRDVSTFRPIQSTLKRKGDTDEDRTAAKAVLARYPLSSEPLSPPLRPQVRMHWQRKFPL